MKNRNITFTTILLAFGIVALSQIAQAVVPAPDGAYGAPAYGVGNTAEGQNALLSLTNGTYNTAVGVFSLESNAAGSFNTALGAGTLLFNTADENTATGAGALLSNTTGTGNLADGAFALFSNTEGGSNTAVGDRALFSNTTGADNTANGAFALFSNTTGSDNAAIGTFALSNNTTGGFNTASGTQALFNNTTGSKNTADGFDALVSNIGSNNTATGVSALFSNTTGGGNTASGYQALLNNTTGNSNTAIGGGALFNNTTGSVNVAVGDFAGGNLTTGDVNIDILNPGVAGETNTIRIGVTQTQTFIAGISGQTASGGAAVFVNSDGKLGTFNSSARFKDEIKPMGKASEAILGLKPVSFRYKKEIDPQRIPQFGLVAEEVEKVNPDLIIRDPKGKPHTVRYEQINAMLLNEFLKEHRKVQDLEKGMAAVTAQLKEQAAQIQKVSAHLEMSKPTTKVVLNNP